MESRERYFIGNPQVDFILSQIADRLDILEGLRPNLVEGLYKLLTSKEITTTSDTTFIFDNDGLHINDIDGSHYLTISPSSNLTANRVLTIVTGDSSRTLTLSGSPTVGDWFDQSVKAAAGPSFDHLHLTAASPAAPLVVTSDVLVSNLNADLLDGQHAVAFEVAGAVAAHAPLITGVHGLVFTAGKTLTLTESLTLNALPVGGLTVATAANTLGSLAVGLTTQVLVGGGAATVPAWATDLPAAVTIGSAYVYRVSGTDVAVADGGTGLSVFAVGDIVHATGTTTLAGLADVAVGAYLASGGANTVPAWATLNQAAVAGLTTADSPTWVTGKFTALTDGYLPYHVSDASGLANSPIRTDGNYVGIRAAPDTGYILWVESGGGIKPLKLKSQGPYSEIMYQAGPDGTNNARMQWQLFNASGVSQFNQMFVNDAESLAQTFLSVYTNNNTYTIDKLIVPYGNFGIATTLIGAGVTYQKLNVNGSQLFVGADTTQESPMFQVVPSYVVNTHASYTSRTILSQWAIGGAQEVVRFESGAAAMLSFFGVNAVVRPTALTAALTAITHTAPGTPDYALQDLIDSSAGACFGFATKDEGNTLLSAVVRNQVRLGEIETKLQALGLLT